jgi:hypothetical protein
MFDARIARVHDSWQKIHGDKFLARNSRQDVHGRKFMNVHRH